jgi:hypothetical protein
LRRLTVVGQLLVLLAFLVVPGTIFGADSTSFNPLPVTVKAQGSGVPVGTVVAWPASSNPEDAENWLECNGQSTTGYPELAAIVGPTVPNYQGLFLRGHGSQVADSGGYGAVNHASGALGAVQGDAIRNLYGNLPADIAAMAVLNKETGVFHDEGVINEGDSGQSGYPEVRIFSFNASRVVPTATENRPVNMAVRYLIRAKP